MVDQETRVLSENIKAERSVEKRTGSQLLQRVMDIFTSTSSTSSILMALNNINNDILHGRQQGGRATLMNYYPCDPAPLERVLASA